MRKATLCFLVRKADKGPEVLLAMKKRGFGRGKWNGIGGKVRVGETVEDAARREITEEIGVEVAGLQKVALLTFYFIRPKCDPNWNQEVHVFLATSWGGEPEESVEMEPRWYAYRDVPYEQMWADDRIWLPRVLQGERINGVFTFSDVETIVHQEITPRDG